MAQDTAGQERFRALGPIYYRDRRAHMLIGDDSRPLSNGAVLVYDITDADSFERVKNWVKELRQMLGNAVSLVIVGNKIDLEKNRVVPAATAEASVTVNTGVCLSNEHRFAASVGAQHFYTSAKLNKGIEEMFLDLTKRACITPRDNVQMVRQGWCRVRRRRVGPGAARAALWSAMSRPRSKTTAPAAEAR